MEKYDSLTPSFSCWKVLKPLVFLGGNFSSKRFAGNYCFKVSMLLSKFFTPSGNWTQLAEKNNNIFPCEDKQAGVDFLPGLDFRFFAFQPLKEASLPHGLPRFFCIFSVSVVFVAGTEMSKGNSVIWIWSSFCWVVWCNFERGEHFFL